MAETLKLVGDFIAQIGFPIAVAAYMIYTNNHQNELHREEQKEMTGAINDLKIVIQALIDKLED